MRRYIALVALPLALSACAADISPEAVYSDRDSAVIRVDGSVYLQNGQAVRSSVESAADAEAVSVCRKYGRRGAEFVEVQFKSDNAYAGGFHRRYRCT